MIKSSLYILVYLISALATPYALACESPIKVQQLESGKDNLMNALLTLAISKSAPERCVKTNDEVMTTGREVMHVKKGLLDVLWSSGHDIRGLMPVRVPIFKGILGYRMFVIRKGEQARFDNISSIEDLKKLKAGLGKGWGDTIVLQNAGIPMVTTTRARFLWPMLDNKRYDYLPIAVHEPWEDLALRPELKLTTEENILIRYDSAMYFYVNSKNTELAKLISDGMKKAIDDGSYDDLLYQSEMIQSAIKFANVDKRRVIEIPNPKFHDKTPKENLKYWMKPDELKAYLKAK